jgi:glutamate racemase
MKIAIFDSGVGGLSFKRAITNRFPKAQVVYFEDKENIPYGDKSKEKLLELTLPIFKNIDNQHFDAILVACNTVTTNIINKLRESIKTPIVGVEPMLKPGAQLTKTKVIAVCATPATLNSERYSFLRRNYTSKLVVVEPDCSEWAYMIENNRKNELKLKEMVDELKQKKVDVLILGCTHYHWIEKELKDLSGSDIKVIQPIEPVLNQLERVILESSQNL